MSERDDDENSCQCHKAMSYMIPKDPMILYSYINMMLRDRGESLADLCAEIDADMDEIVDALAAAGFEYDETVNQFR